MDGSVCHRKATTARVVAGKFVETQVVVIRDNVGVSESFVASGYLQVVDVALHDDQISCDHDDFLDEGERGAVEITLRNAGTSTLGVGRVSVSASIPELVFDTDGVFAVPALAPFDSVVVRAGVTLRGARTAQQAKIVVAVGDLSIGAPYIADLQLAAGAQVDEVAQASAVDHVDTRTTAWEVLGTDGPVWSQVKVGEERWWYVPNSFYTSDHELDSPALLAILNEAVPSPSDTAHWNTLMR